MQKLLKCLTMTYYIQKSNITTFLFNGQHLSSKLFVFFTVMKLFGVVERENEMINKVEK